MNGLLIRFSPDLGFFRKGGAMGPEPCDLSRRASVKDIIESFGIPHTEVGQICFQGRVAGFDLVPDRPGLIEVWGISPPLDVGRCDRLHPDPFRSVAFIADLNVLKLGRYLLFLGYDTALAQGLTTDADIAALAQAERRIVLTRDTRLLFRRNIQFGRRIRSVYPLDQVRETLDCFGLTPDPALFFSRCTICNLVLNPVEKAAVDHLLEPKTRRYIHVFRQCPGCRQVFWKGSHHEALLKRFKARSFLKTDCF